MHRLLTGRGSSRARILLVDHDEKAKEMLQRKLSETGYEVSTCTHPAEALERLQDSQVPDLIVFELSTPVMDGWQFRLRQRRLPRLFGIPVIAVSEDGSAKAEAIDADAYLRKPIDYEELRETIARLLSSFERKRAQARQLELGRLSSLGTLAAGVAHEINNPLTFVSGNITVAMERCRRASEAESLEAARGMLLGVSKALAEAMVGANRIQNVVRGLSAFARPSAAEAVPLDVVEVLEIASQLTQNEVRHRAMLVRDYGDLPHVRGSKARLGQVFVNLLLNAAQAIPEGRAHDNQIRITARAEADSVVVEISDTGRGIAPEMLGHIYEPFFTTKPVGVGMGLGLSICHAAMQAMGGSIDVESELGKGATFRVTLPLADGVVANFPQDKPRSDPTSATRRGRVLVIDDEELICNLLISMLSPQHEVTGLSNAREAMQRIVEGARYDVILCDLMMPDMTGMDFYAALQKHAPEQVSQLVFLTGGAFTEASRRFLDSIANTQLSKPFTLPEVLDIVQNAVSRADAQ